MDSLERKSLTELKEIASMYGLSEWDLWGPIRKKTSWIDAIKRAQSFSQGFINSDTERAIARLVEWLIIEAPKNSANPIALQSRLQMSKPAFWYAIYALRERGILQFEEPQQLDIKYDKNRT